MARDHAVVWVLDDVGGFSFLKALHPGTLIGPADGDTVSPHSVVGPPEGRVVVPPEGRTVLLVTGYEQARRFLTDPR